MANDDLPICAPIPDALIGRIPDRRKRQRLAAQWPLRIWKASDDAIDTHTVNVSSDGFYCLLPRPLPPGEILSALLDISGTGSNEESRHIVLCCDIHVLRSETSANGRAWGVAFRILSYSVLRTANTEMDCNQDNQLSRSTVAEF